MPIPGSIEVGQLVRDIEAAVMEAVTEAVVETVDLGERYAKRLAPRRKVSYISRNRQTRSLSRAEVASLPALIRDSAQRIQRRGGRVLTTIRRSRQTLDAPEVEEDVGGFYHLKNRSDEVHLTRRGRGELSEVGVTASRLRSRFPNTMRPMQVVRSGRLSAIYTERSRVLSGRNIRTSARSTLGGRLRGEIFTDLETRGGRVTGSIVSPTEYARYVEFPTSRTAAQPYMRPTLKYLKRPFMAKVRRNLANIGKRR